MDDPAVLRRLVVAKRFLSSGRSSATNPHDYSELLIAPIELFLAVETVLKSAVLSSDAQPTAPIGRQGYSSGPPSPEQISKFNIETDRSFDHLFDQVLTIFRHIGSLSQDELLVRWDRLRRLQAARNAAQHHATAPNPTDLPDLISIAKETCDRITILAFSSYGSSIEKVSLSPLIGDPVLRELLQDAERSRAASKPRHASLLVRITFLLGRLKRRYDYWEGDRAQRIIDDYDYARVITESWNHTGLGYRTDEPTARFLADVMHQVLSLPHLFDNWVLGLDQADRLKLEASTPRLIYYPPNFRGLPTSDEKHTVPVLNQILNDLPHWQGPSYQHDPQPDEVDWALNFVLDTLLRWESEQTPSAAPVPSAYAAVSHALGQHDLSSPFASGL